MDVKNLFDTAKYSAFLFDCDGTIADSMPLHLIAWNRALAKWGARLSEAEHEMWAGRPTRRIVQLLNEEHGLNIDADVVAHDKESAYFDLIPTVEPVAAVAETIRAYHGRVPFAVVSGSPRESVIKTLRHLNLLSYFQVIVGAEDYVHGKPAPDCFLKAAEALHVAPSRSLAFEDADLGVKAAAAAGMSWVRVASRGFVLEHSRF